YCSLSLFFFFFHYPATPQIYTLSLHDALPISVIVCCSSSILIAHPFSAGNSLASRAPMVSNSACTWAEEMSGRSRAITAIQCSRSEEHTSELQSRGHLVCRLLLEKKKNHYENE